MSQGKNILLFEDEQLAGEKLMKLILAVHPVANVIWKRSVADGIAYLEGSPTLDLIFSDIELLDGDSFQIYKKCTPPCPIIFCTAYDQFYVNAFQTNGIAYLLKPYTKEQFLSAWEKYDRLFSQNNIEEDLFAKLKMMMEQEKKTYKSSFSVKKRDGVFLLKTNNIVYFQAQGDFVLAIDSNNTKHVLNTTLSKTEELINPQQFFKINRSEIINKEFILKYNLYRKNRLAITLSKPSVVLYTSNSRAAGFKSWLEG